MKHSKKLFSLLMALVMALSLTSGFTAKAAEAQTDQLTVTLRVEQDASTLLAPVKVTLTEADKKDYGIGLSTETLTPLHALAKYLQTEKNVSDENMADYISQSSGWIQSIKVNESDNGTPSSISQSETSWMFAVNNKGNIVNEAASEGSDYDINYTSYDYPLENNDSVLFYGVWYGVYGKIDAYYSAFEKDSYEAKTNQDITLSLKQCGIYDMTNTLSASADSVVIASKAGSPTPEQYELKGTTDKNGNVTLKFPSAGTYTLSAYRELEVEQDDGTTAKHYDISRPYAVVTVTDEQTSTVNPSKPNNTSNTNTTNTGSIGTGSKNDSTGDNQSTTALKKPAKVTKLKAVVKKSKKAKKSVKLTWKKAANAKGYQVYTYKKLKLKKNAAITGSTVKYVKKATVKKNKAVIKLKKGTYKIKVRAYNKSGKKTKKGAFSKIITVKVK